MMINVICSSCRTRIRQMDDCHAETVLESHGVCEGRLPLLLRDMGIPMDEFLDSLAVPILVVGDEGRVIAANAPAQKLEEKTQFELTGCLGGEVISCDHAREPGGCGQTVHCESCAIRRSVMHTMRTGQPCRNVPAYADIGLLSNAKRVELLISTEKNGRFVQLTVHKTGISHEAGFRRHQARPDVIAMRGLPGSVRR